MITLINSHLYQLLEQISKILCFIYIFFYFMDISKAISFGTKLILVSIWSLRSLRRLQGKVQRLLRQCENYFPSTSSDRSHCYDNGGWNGLEFKLNGKKKPFCLLRKIDCYAVRYQTDYDKELARYSNPHSDLLYSWFSIRIPFHFYWINNISWFVFILWVLRLTFFVHLVLICLQWKHLIF